MGLCITGKNKQFLVTFRALLPHNIVFKWRQSLGEALQVSRTGPRVQLLACAHDLHSWQQKRVLPRLSKSEQIQCAVFLQAGEQIQVRGFICSLVVTALIRAGEWLTAPSALLMREKHWGLVRSSPGKTWSTFRRKCSLQSNKNEVKVCSCFRCIAATWLNNEPLKWTIFVFV